jgi:hypothetical protein
MDILSKLNDELVLVVESFPKSKIADFDVFSRDGKTIVSVMFTCGTREFEVNPAHAIGNVSRLSDYTSTRKLVQALEASHPSVLSVSDKRPELEF